MTTRSQTGTRIVVLAVVGAAVVAALLLLALGANPWEAFKLLFEGSFGSMDKLSATLLVWVPLAIASASLVVTYSAGLWNIGVEGQIIMGAIFASWAARTVPGPGWFVMLMGIVMKNGILLVDYTNTLRARGRSLGLLPPAA